jgi:hypothetical protein
MHHWPGGNQQMLQWTGGNHMPQWTGSNTYLQMVDGEDSSAAFEHGGNDDEAENGMSSTFSFSVIWIGVLQMCE